MSQAAAKILVIDDESQTGMIFSRILEEEGCQVFAETSGEDGLARLLKNSVDLVFLDLRLPAMDGVEVLRRIHQVSPQVPVVVMTAYQTVSSAVECMKLGAVDYLTKPLQSDHLKEVVRHALQIRNKLAAPKFRRSEGGLPPEELIGKSASSEELRRLIGKVAPTDLTVLLLGESGTGKEIAARSIHEASQRRRGPFVPVDCAAIPETLIESELFGYEKGAFTGADLPKPGRFELAAGGTLFLDEIGNLPPLAQAKLLRVLQDMVVERLGGTQALRADVRIIAATNRDLESAVREGAFREDLYHRLKVFPIDLQPLRSRPEDMDLLVDYFLKRYNKEFGKNVPGVSSEAMALFRGYRWPGNIRELANVLRSATLLSDGPIEPAHLPASVRFSKPPADGSPAPAKDAALRDVVKRVEREHILKTLKAAGWNRAEAARALGVDYKTLYNKIKEHKISEKEKDNRSK
jgi:DNA-binding NtrC family response regulator